MPNYKVVNNKIELVRSLWQMNAERIGNIDTVIHKQEMYGSADVKANQTMLEEIEAAKGEEGEDNGTS